MPISAQELAQAFAAGLAHQGPTQEPPPGELLVELLERCRQAWPELPVQPEDFVRHLAKHLPAGEPIRTALLSMRCKELYLALGALGGDRVALEELERTALEPARRAVMRVGGNAAFVDEAMQLTRIRLLVGSDRHGPRLEEFAGKGALRRWTEAMAVGVALSLKRRPAQSSLDDEEAALSALLDSADPEISVLRDRYRPAFRAAFIEALSRLSPRDRNLLRLSVIQGLGVESLGALHQVHASTASRWLARARSDLLAGTRAGLSQRLGLDAPQLDSLLRVLDGHLAVSLSVLLREG